MHAELHRKVVELQMSRAMLVLQHPVIAAALAGSAESHAMMTQIIAQAMFAGLDQVVVHEHGKNLFAPPGKLEQMQEDLQLLTLEFSNASAPASGTLRTQYLASYLCITAMIRFS